MRTSWTGAGLDPLLVQAVMQVESGYNRRALSNKGAIGLMQLMPGTAELLAVADPWDVSQNVRGGVKYLKRLMDRFEGKLEYALAGYNAGPNAVERHGGVPPYPETETYVRRILSLYRGSEAAPINGRKVYVTRDAQNRLVMTTAAPASL